MPVKIAKPKPKPKPAPAAPAYYPIRLTCPELLSWDAKRTGAEPWVWLPARTSLPAFAAVRFEPFESPCQSLVDGGTGRRLVTATATATVKGWGKVVVCGAGIGGRAVQLVTAVPVVDAAVAADCFAGTYGNPLSDEWFEPRRHGRLLLRRFELAMMGLVALACRSGETEGMTAEPLADEYADGWAWQDECPVGPVGSKERLDDPRTWVV